MAQSLAFPTHTVGVLEQDNKLVQDKCVHLEYECIVLFTVKV